MRHAKKSGELVALKLEYAYLYLPPWWHWTISLDLAFMMESIILPRDKRKYP